MAYQNIGENSMIRNVIMCSLLRCDDKESCHPEDGGNIFWRNVGNDLQKHMTSQARSYDRQLHRRQNFKSQVTKVFTLILVW